VVKNMSEAPDDLSLPAELLATIYAQSRAEFPGECCGYLKGRGAASRLFACQNFMDKLHAMDPETYPRTSANGYNFGGRELMAFTRAFDGDDPPTVIYHSHPRVGAYFSAEDEAAALAAGYPVDYLVVDVQEDGVREAVLFRRAAAPTATGAAYAEIARFPGETR
jgi:[CysO sulfur-carrier protein]-S-L-cysteine hydrolase